jgi:hypothetical protein
MCIKYIANPNFGATNFDNIFYSFLTNFFTVTLTGWSDLMSKLRITSSEFAIVF